MLGHCVSVLLAVLHSHESKEVRRAACGSLLALTGVDGDRVMGGGMEGERCTGLSDEPSHSDHAYSLWKTTDCLGPRMEGGGASGSVFASFLPGISMSLCKLVTTDTKVGQVSDFNMPLNFCIV